MARQSPAQKAKIGRVMHEFRHGDLEMHGRRVGNPKQAIAIALHEAGAARDQQQPAPRGEAGRKGCATRAAGRDDRRSRAALYEEAKRRNIPGRSRMGKAELQAALKRGRR